MGRRRRPALTLATAVVLAAGGARAATALVLHPQADLSRALLEERLRVELTACNAGAHCTPPETVRVERGGDARLVVTLGVSSGEKQRVLTMTDVTRDDRERVVAMAVAELARDDEVPRPPPAAIAAPLEPPKPPASPRVEVDSERPPETPRRTRLGAVAGVALHGGNDLAFEAALRLGHAPLAAPRLELQAELAYQHGSTSTPLGTVAVNAPYVGAAALYALLARPFVFQGGPFARAGVVLADGAPSVGARSSAVQGVVVAVGARLGARLATSPFAPAVFVDLGGVPLGLELTAAGAPTYRIAGLHIGVAIGAAYAF